MPFHTGTPHALMTRWKKPSPARAREGGVMRQLTPLFDGFCWFPLDAQRERAQPQITETSPKVAVNSLKRCAFPARTWREAKNSGSPNIRCVASDTGEC